MHDFLALTAKITRAMGAHFDGTDTAALRAVACGRFVPSEAPVEEGSSVELARNKLDAALEVVVARESASRRVLGDFVVQHLN